MSRVPVAQLPLRKIETSGITYIHPHLSFDTDPPYDLEDLSDWEAQEIRSHWRDAIREAEVLHRCANSLLYELYHDANPDAFNEMGAGGNTQPVYLAMRLAQSLLKLNGAWNGAQHRLALELKAEMAADDEWQKQNDEREARLQVEGMIAGERAEREFFEASLDIENDLEDR